MAFLQKSSVHVKIVCIFSCICILSMLGFIIYIYSTFSGEVTKNARDSQNQSLIKTENVVSGQMRIIENSCREMIRNNILTQFLDSGFTGSGSEIVNFNKLVFPYFLLRKKLLPEVYSVWIYSDNATVPLSWMVEAGIAPMQYCMVPINNKPSNIDYWWEPFSDNNVPFIARDVESPSQLFSYDSMIRSPSNGSIIGIISYQIKAESLFQAVANAENNTSGTLYAVQDNGKILFSGVDGAEGKMLSDIYPDQGDLFKAQPSGGFVGENASYHVSSANIPELECSIVSVQSFEDIKSQMLKTTATMILVLALASIVVILLVSLISFKIMKRIRMLGNAMTRVDGGDYTVSVDPGANDEFGRLINAFNRMISKLNELINNVYRTQIREKEAQLRALEAQVNPHFLYNTLTSIAYAAKDNGDADAYRMALSLGKFYRLGLTNKTELITVSDELEYLNMYLTIQKIRFKDRVNYRFDIDEQYLSCKLIRNVLQPLVENAISHGLNDKLEGGVVTVRMKRVDQNLEFEVQDNGVGMDPYRLQQINECGFDGNAASGYGLKNVNDRLQIYYGEHYRLSAESKPGEGTSIFVRVPIRR